MSKFTYASLFSGIGGFEQALNKLGGECVFASEINKFAARAYEILYGFKPAGDITKIDAKDIPDHDLLVAGFPCQAFSVAGKRKGFDDTRGTLFFEIARIAREKQPKALLLENVKGLVNHDKGRTLDIMIKTLNEIGYTVDFDVLNSKYFGVPQNRERIFIVAIRDDLIEQEPWIIEGNTIVPKGKRRISEYEWAKTFNFDWPEQTEVTTRLRDILENDVDEKYYLDEEKTERLIKQLEEKEPSSSSFDNCEMVGKVDLKGNDSIRRVYASSGVAPTLTAMGGGRREPKIAEAQEIANGGNISYCVDANYSKGISLGSIGKGRRTHIKEVRPVHTSDRMEKRQNGRRFKDNDEESFTITTQDIHGVAIGQPSKYRIRKLTPRECWRLQGFPDDAHDAVMSAGISDSQRYKQAGNAVTVNVIDAIGRRLLPYIDA